MTSTGQYVIAWDFAKVKKGQMDKYEIKKYEDLVVQDNFRFGDDKEIVSPFMLRDCPFINRFRCRLSRCRTMFSASTRRACASPHGRHLPLSAEARAATLVSSTHPTENDVSPLRSTSAPFATSLFRLSLPDQPVMNSTRNRGCMTTPASPSLGTDFVCPTCSRDCRNLVCVL